MIKSGNVKVNDIDMFFLLISLKRDMATKSDSYLYSLEATFVIPKTLVWISKEWYSSTRISFFWCENKIFILVHVYLVDNELIFKFYFQYLSFFSLNCFNLLTSSKMDKNLVSYLKKKKVLLV